ncbi:MULTISPECIES: cytochrome P450 [unclassified Crossiella]|uniref:cytochrome P450 n=1 Tax=unclassified Crossiella TaxID=2620835 RepID=UPI001FFEDBF9|nr:MULTISPECIES: cytochrome P450 [unclassified Crossiella]MCK2238571.1 cytochrome P450 [Crossiella sp. S99.2]MCK2251859.1 cytochrome P450 [Crossiella sp. S99.1]
MTTAPNLEELPLLLCTQPVVGRLDPVLRELQSRGPITKVRTRAGDEAWLVSRHAELKKLLLDGRLENAHPDPANRPRYLDSPVFDYNLLGTDFTEANQLHRDFRSALTPLFSARRVAVLREGIRARVHALLDQLIEQGPPADLHSEFSLPLSHGVLSDLLGVPDERTFISLLLAVDDEASVGAVFGHLVEAVTWRMAHPGPDIITALAEAGVPVEQIVSLVSTISFPFLVTPGVQSVGIGLFAAHPEQRDLLARDPGLIETAVDEVLRMGQVVESVMPRYAESDIEISGVTIRAGELVLCDHYSANYDELVFPDSERFDITRAPNPHLAFSHGISHCIGAPLAKVQLSETFSALIARLPGLALTVPVHEIPMNVDPEAVKLGGGVDGLPVTW